MYREIISHIHTHMHVCVGFVVVQLLSHVQLFVTRWIAAHQAPLSFTVSWSLLKFMYIELVTLSVSPSAAPHLLLPSIFPASESFPLDRLFAPGGQSCGASAIALVLPMNIQGWFPLGLTGLIFLLSNGLSRVFSSTAIQKHPFFSVEPSLWPTVTSIHDYWKNHSFDYMDLDQQSDVSAF